MVVPSPPKQLAMYFIGVTTGKSFINKLFPVWAEILGIAEAQLEGIDLPVNDAPDSYREIIQFLKSSHLVQGALVTTHKINIWQYAGDLFEQFDRYADLLGEVCAISKEHGLLTGSAQDAITSGLALKAIVGDQHWNTHREAQALILGSGGSALALATHLIEQPEGNQPRRIILTGRSPAKLEHLRTRLAHIDSRNITECRHIRSAQEHDDLIREAPHFSLVVNATGMGKDRPGSPVSDRVKFPRHGIVWEFNYRGELNFMHQALAQASARDLIVEDGWRYFLHGWSHAITNIFHLPLSEDLFDRLKAAAEQLRQA